MAPSSTPPPPSPSRHLLPVFSTPPRTLLQSPQLTQTQYCIQDGRPCRANFSPARRRRWIPSPSKSSHPDAIQTEGDPTTNLW
ncbi:hypothetical protein DAI22_07g278600 [Oryza sativa Japonica Group]|nr:hypothetical protein DAI22_07g278600 [Oryza sativa Japonica Group]